MRNKIFIVLTVCSAIMYGQSSTNIVQSDNANQITLQQIGLHSINITQLGFMNLVSSLQTGTNNQFLVQQIQNSYGNLSFTTQRGLNNIGELYQINNDNRSYLTQNGNNNSSYQFQNLGTINTSYSEISQTSDWNSATTTQSSGSKLYALIEQNGSSNNSTITQSGGSDIAGHSARIWQFGNNNIATQNQSGVVVSPFLGNTATIMQIYTSSSQASQTQSGNENSASINQLVGNNNIAQVTQSGDNHYSTTSQYGAGNSVRVSQHLGNQNYSNLLQNNGSSAFIDQNGSFNSLKGIDSGIEVDQAQSLGASALTVLQTGLSNISRVYQQINEILSISQTGSGNIIIIQQR